MSPVASTWMFSCALRLVAWRVVSLPLVILILSPVMVEETTDSLRFVSRVLEELKVDLEEFLISLNIESFEAVIATLFPAFSVIFFPPMFEEFTVMLFTALTLTSPPALIEEVFWRVMAYSLVPDELCRLV